MYDLGKTLSLIATDRYLSWSWHVCVCVLVLRLWFVWNDAQLIIRVTHTLELLCASTVNNYGSLILMQRLRTQKFTAHFSRTHNHCIYTIDTYFDAHKEQTLKTIWGFVFFFITRA